MKAPNSWVSCLRQLLNASRQSKKTSTMFSSALPEQGLRGYAVIFQHSKILHYPETTMYMVSFNIHVYFREVSPTHSSGLFLLQTINTILLSNLIHYCSLIDVHMIFGHRNCIGLKTSEQNI